MRWPFVRRSTFDTALGMGVMWAEQVAASEKLFFKTQAQYVSRLQELEQEVNRLQRLIDEQWKPEEVDWKRDLQTMTEERDAAWAERNKFRTERIKDGLALRLDLTAALERVKELEEAADPVRATLEREARAAIRGED